MSTVTASAMKIDDIKKLQQKKYRQEFGHFLIEGEHLLQELARAAESNPALKASRLYITEELQQVVAPFANTFVTTVVSSKQMAQLSDTKTPQGIVGVVPISAITEALTTNLTTTSLITPPAEKPKTIYLHEVQDPGNLGTILRTLAWFGGFRCLLSANSVDPFNPKTVRASMGAIFHVTIEQDVALNSLCDRFEKIAYLDIQGQPLTDAAFIEFDCYLFGNEARGVPADELQNLKADAFSIPGCGAIESLNLASAVNMCVYELKR